MRVYPHDAGGRVSSIVWCTGCDGAGGGLAEDWDDEGQRSAVRVECEFCLGCGEHTSCVACGEPCPLPVAEAGRGRCEACVEDGVRADDDAERERIARVA